MTYNISVEDTLKNATRLIQVTTAVKCEVRKSHLPTIERLVQEGILDGAYYYSPIHT